jgi:hypothetical protein
MHEYAFGHWYAKADVDARIASMEGEILLSDSRRRFAVEQRDAALAEVEALRADAERYRWLVSHESYAMFVEAEDKAALDAAIDAARGGP